MDLSNAFLPVKLTTLFARVSAPILQKPWSSHPCFHCLNWTLLSTSHTKSRGAPFY